MFVLSYRFFYADKNELAFTGDLDRTDLSVYFSSRWMRKSFTKIREDFIAQYVLQFLLVILFPPFCLFFFFFFQKNKSS